MTSKNNEEQKRIMEEYSQWKKTAPVLYDMVITHNLTWPTLTCQWLPKRTIVNGFVKQQLLIGTHTNDEESNYVQYLDVDIPEKGLDTPEEQKTKMYITQKISHEGEVNKARYQPDHPDVFATKTRDGDVLVYDKDQLLLRLKGHTMEGYGLAWNPHKTSHLLSAGFDNLICHWDIGLTPNNDRELQPYQTYAGHTGCVEDVSWNSANDNLFASVADDMKLMLWDCRDSVKPVQQVQAHQNEVNSVAFHPNKDWMLATGSSDKTVGLFDIRKMNEKLHSMETHEGEVTQVAWSPHDDPILASAGADRRIVIWDLRRIGQEQTPEDAEDGPPEIMFVHSGHTSRISDFSWNPTDRWVLASAAEDNVVQIWQMSRNIYANTDSLQVASSQLE
ncbi:WD40-repeat-containing domain protein [Gilbertella persicaria]|uniref:WD40-repeat-containing domain protein n=1 Tax=Gilbertella persicaria TaxID=101096 RepID=UPI00221FDE87|nr:WD40-repeat-containing domain protein [Gilbertella persicaria]KAI8098407.1 WD40-repeat-containing domain protein [Gilbertella persicaria]